MRSRKLDHIAIIVFLVLVLAGRHPFARPGGQVYANGTALDSDVAIYLIGLIFQLVYFLVLKILLGVDGKPPSAIVPQWEVPGNLSPAAVRYIANMGYDSRVFSAALISAIVKGCLKVEIAGSVYRITPSGSNRESLAEEEWAAIDCLFANRDTLVLEGHAQAKTADSQTRVAKSLASQFCPLYFGSNFCLAIGGPIVEAVALFCGYASGKAPMDPMFALWLLAWASATAVMFSRMLISWRRCSAQPEKVTGNIILSLLALMFAATLPFLAWIKPDFRSFILAVFCMSLVNALFMPALKTHTRVGRRLLEEIEGFRLYLETAEKQTLRSADPQRIAAETTTEHSVEAQIKQLTAYAVALDIRQPWSEHFESALHQTQDDIPPISYEGTISK